MNTSVFLQTHRKREFCWKPTAAAGGLGWWMLGAEPALAAGRRQQVPDLPSTGEGGGKRQANF